MASSTQEHDQDLLLARVLQEQERAFHAMLMSQTGAAKTPVRAGMQQQQQQASGVSLSDEDLARQLQDQEDAEAYEADEGYSYEAEVDYDRLSYEEYNALGDVAGAVNKGLSAEVLQQLPCIVAAQHKLQQCSCKAQQQAVQAPAAAAAAAAAGLPAPDYKMSACSCAASSSLCVVCQCEFEGGEVLKLLPSCGHVYHQECIKQWLAGSKDCPICHKEVAVSNKEGSATSTQC